MYDLIKENELILNFGAKIKSSAFRIAKFSDRKIRKNSKFSTRLFFKIQNPFSENLENSHGPTIKERLLSLGLFFCKSNLFESFFKHWHCAINADATMKLTTIGIFCTCKNPEDDGCLPNVLSKEKRDFWKPGKVFRVHKAGRLARSR